MNNKDKIKRLKKILSSAKKLLIFNHFNPDTDSLTSSLILSEIVKHFKVKSKIVYNGKITYSKNLAMVTYLNLKVYPYVSGEEKKYDLIASVDTQKGNSNNAIPEDIFPHLTFDHHPRVNKANLNWIKRSEKSDNYLNDIRTHYGSAASILMEYYLALGLKLNSKIATAFCYTIVVETNHFTRKYSENEVSFYRQAIQEANFRLIAKIESTKKPVIYFQVLNKVINNHKQKGNLLTCSLGEITNLDFLHEIANFMLTMDGIEFVVITGINEELKKICCRSSNRQIHLGHLLQAVLKKIGSGGGHETMAAGEFYISERRMIQLFTKHLMRTILLNA